MGKNIVLFGLLVCVVVVAESAPYGNTIFTKETWCEKNELEKFCDYGVYKTSCNATKCYSGPGQQCDVIQRKCAIGTVCNLKINKCTSCFNDKCYFPPREMVLEILSNNKESKISYPQLRNYDDSYYLN